MTETRFEFPQPVDILAVEREARRLRAKAVAEMAQTAVAWLRARFARSPEGRAA
jgi:hypothetical protein